MMLLGQTVAEIMAIFRCFKMAAVFHLGFVACVFGLRTFSGLCHCTKFGWKRIDAVVSIICKF